MQIIRKDILTKALKDNMSDIESKLFTSYLLTEDDNVFLNEVIEAALNNLPNKPLSCGSFSAILAAMIQDHSNIPVAVISGHLDVDSIRIFNCLNPIPYDEKREIINEMWDGHCWVEINNLIIDISIFPTVYQGNVNKELRDKMAKQFGEHQRVLMGSPEQLLQKGLFYTPCFSLSENQINGLIRGLCD